jgi:hypothetical protein
MCFSGIHRGLLLGQPPTGKRVSWAGAALFHARGGKLESLWVLGDLESLRRQLRADPWDIRRATADDVGAIAKLHAESWRSAYRVSLSDEYLDGPFSPIAAPLAEKLFTILTRFSCFRLPRLRTHRLRLRDSRRGRGVGRPPGQSPRAPPMEGEGTRKEVDGRCRAMGLEPGPAPRFISGSSRRTRRRGPSTGGSGGGPWTASSGAHRTDVRSA